MKIDQSWLHLEAESLAWQQHSRTRTQTLTREPADSPRAAPEPPKPGHIVPTDQTSKTESVPAQNGIQTLGLDARLNFLIAIVEALTGRKVEIYDGLSLRESESESESGGAGTADHQFSESEHLRSQARAVSSNRGPGWSVRIETHQIHEEFESASFSAAGTVETADGRQISFNLDLMMLRYEKQESSSLLISGNQPKATDPLVLNLATDQVRLSAGKFSFDLNSDGVSEQIAALAPGSAYLALDRNGNGLIDDGKELFGPGSGNGFNELAAFDSDGNGWIDENDPVWTQLSVWQPGSSLQSLKSADVGAIALAHQATPFSLQAAGATTGLLRSSGVFLRESGSVGSIQQIDLLV